MQSINIIGAGKLGRTLGRLFAKHGLLEVRAVLTRSLASATDAVASIGAGTPIPSWTALPPADFHLLAVPDDRLAASAERLAATGILRTGDIVFHCSGATSSDVLAPAAERGALTGSIHPIKSFADPSTAAATFAGTSCAVEGDASDELRLLFTALGGSVFTLASDRKLIYHAATVFACNNLIALVEVAARCLTHCGLERDQTMALLLPTMAEILANVQHLGPAKALTGPVVRGDAELIAKQLAALEVFDPATAAVYRSLGMFAVELAKERGTPALDAVAAALQSR